MADKSPLRTTIIHQLNSTYANRAPHTNCGLIDSHQPRSAPERRRSGQGSAPRSYRCALPARGLCSALQQPEQEGFQQNFPKNQSKQYTYIFTLNIYIFFHVMPSCLSGLYLQSPVFRHFRHCGVVTAP